MLTLEIRSVLVMTKIKKLDVDVDDDVGGDVDDEPNVKGEAC